ncbi:immunoglobulin superfamily member 5 isoform X1 [Paramisgurnus dabryanus]|uniref:immunoglobulin superfamily member 5 isoform X1 n=1 Tax=Paramisgurnus dabryanus TaxID=90735 RepID=UPI0031F43B5D
MDVFILSLFLLTIRGVSAQTVIEPQNTVVLKGSQARFNCSINQAQTGMIWLLNGRLVVTIQQTEVKISNSRFAVTNLTSPGSYKWEFIINNVVRGDTGQVTCQILDEVAQISTLSVQERGSVVIIDGNQTATEGVQKTFQCQAVGWYPEPTVSWSVNGVGVNTCNNNSVAQGNVFNTNCTLTVTAAKSSSVQCLAKVPAMSTPDSNTVFLTVETYPYSTAAYKRTTEVPKASTRDQTILIAVTVAFSAAALLFLLIVLIIICCRRKREKSSYEEEVRRAQLQAQHRSRARGDGHGHDNRGYARDGHYGDNYNGGVWHTNQSNKHQRAYPMDDYNGPRNHRHLTMV